VLIITVITSKSITDLRTTQYLVHIFSYITDTSTLKISYFEI